MRVYHDRSYVYRIFTRVLCSFHSWGTYLVSTSGQEERFQEDLNSMSLGFQNKWVVLIRVGQGGHRLRVRGEQFYREVFIKWAHLWVSVVTDVFGETCITVIKYSTISTI